MAGWHRTLALAVGAGLAQAAALADPWQGQPQAWLQMLSLGVVAWQLAGARSARAAALTGWVFSTAWLCGTFWWLFISMHTYGGLAAPLAALAVLGLAAFLGSYYALAAGLWRWRRLQSPLLAGVLGASLWTLAELMRGSWFTGFPWGAGGYAHGDGWLAPLAPWVGVYGIGWVAAFVMFAGAPALREALAGARPPASEGASHAAARLRTALPLAAGALACAAVSWLPVPAGTPAGAPLQVALLQGNISQGEKFEPSSGIPTALRWYGEQLAAPDADLVVAPETALPLLPRQLPEGYMDALLRGYAGGTQAALVGVPLGSFAEGYTNSVIGLDARGAAYRYDKHHLVPFGEFIPPLFRWFTQMMNIPLGDFARGGVGQPSFEWRGQRLAPNVCYEDLFGDELGARFADPARAPTVFVNVSNIAWFGDSLAIDQHLQISRMRAMEFARPMVRATNSGATAVIDHRGEVQGQLPRLTRGVLRAPVQGWQGLTPYAAWVSRFGLWPLWLVCAALALGVLLFRRAPGGPAAPA